MLTSHNNKSIISFFNDNNRKNITPAYHYAGKDIEHYADESHTKRIKEGSARIQLDRFLAFVEIQQYRH